MLVFPVYHFCLSSALHFVGSQHLTEFQFTFHTWRCRVKAEAKAQSGNSLKQRRKIWFAPDNNGWEILVLHFCCLRNCESSSGHPYANINNQTFISKMALTLIFCNKLRIWSSKLQSCFLLFISPPKMLVALVTLLILLMKCSLHCFTNGFWL